MAALSNQLSLFPRAARRNLVLVGGWRSMICSAWLNVSSNALRQGPEIVFFLWMFLVLAFSLLLAAGFVV